MVNGHVTPTLPLTHRVYEKIMERMQEQIAGLTGLKRRVSIWARNKGLRGNRNRQQS